MGIHLHDNSAQKKCILCGRCLDVCPLFAATGKEELSPRAKQQLAEARAKDALPLADAKTLASLCLACGRCEAVCPQGLCAPDLVASFRAAQPGLQEWLWKTWMRRGDVLWPALARLAALLPEQDRTRQLRALAPPREVRPWLTVSGGSVRQREAVAIFPGCLASRVRKSWTRKAQVLLAVSGVEELSQPDWTCCGCTLGHAGLAQEQREARERNINAWRDAGKPRIAAFCATCLCGLRAYARDMSLPWAPGEALAWQQAVTPLSGLLDCLEFTVQEQAPPKVWYHRPCHGAGHKTGKSADQAFLERVAEGRLHLPREARCCGMGGIMQLGAPDLSRDVARHCWEAFDVNVGEQVLTGCSGCVTQLAATAPEGVEVGHWLDALES